MNFLPQGSYFMKVIKKKKFFKKKMQRFICKKNAHGFEPIKLLCVYIYSYYLVLTWSATEEFFELAKSCRKPTPR